MKYIAAFLSHLCVILSLMLITLYIVDVCNPTMAFLSNDIAKLLLLILCIDGLFLALITLAQHRKRK